jgi:hypothetical protein
MEVRVRGGSLTEAMTLLAVLRGYVALEVHHGEARESFLFVRGMFVGPATALARLRALLAGAAPEEVTLVSHDSPAGLYGKPVTAMELVLDPAGTLGA